jgi:hypothetical protein
VKSILIKYIIIIPLIISGINCRKITPTEDNSSTSDDTEQVIYVTSPLIGAIYNPGDTLNIIWESSLNIKSVNITIFKKEELRGIIADQISNEQYYEWVIPLNLLPSTQYKIKIESGNNPDVYNFSGVFSILLQ